MIWGWDPCMCDSVTLSLEISLLCSCQKGHKSVLNKPMPHGGVVWAKGVFFVSVMDSAVVSWKWWSSKEMGRMKITKSMKITKITKSPKSLKSMKITKITKITKTTKTMKTRKPFRREKAWKGHEKNAPGHETTMKNVKTEIRFLGHFYLMDWFSIAQNQVFHSRLGFFPF